MKIYIILYEKYIEGEKDKYGGETWGEGYKTREKAEEKVKEMKKEDFEKGWEYKYYINFVDIVD